MNMNSVEVKIEEGDRQMILLAIAELALSRPGWDDTLGRIADYLSHDATNDGRLMFEGLKLTSADRVHEERSPLGRVMVAQSDDRELLEWLNNAEKDGGDFLSAFARAALRADWENYPLLRPSVLRIRAKYTEYEPTDEAKREIAERPKNA